MSPDQFALLRAPATMPSIVEKVTLKKRVHSILFGDVRTKREILSTISGLNCTLKNHILNIQAVEWLVPIKEKYPALEKRINAFEPEKYGSTEWEKTAFAAFNPDLRE
jgi:hypothetical protein